MKPSCSNAGARPNGLRARCCGSLKGGATKTSSYSMPFSASPSIAPRTLGLPAMPYSLTLIAISVVGYVCSAGFIGAVLETSLKHLDPSAVITVSPCAAIDADIFPAHMDKLHFRAVIFCAKGNAAPGLRSRAHATPAPAYEAVAIPRHGPM